MATNLPALDSTTHTASVTYACTFGLTEAQGGMVKFLVPQPVQFVFEFETGTTQADPAVDLITTETDYSHFDQDTVEASIRSTLTSICGLIATLIGTTQAAIQATVTIARIWRVNPNQTGTMAPVVMPSAPVVYAEPMSYP